jgi:flagellar hook-length control protein FliK
VAGAAAAASVGDPAPAPKTIAPAGSAAAEAALAASPEAEAPGPREGWVLERNGESGSSVRVAPPAGSAAAVSGIAHAGLADPAGAGVGDSRDERPGSEGRSGREAIDGARGVAVGAAPPRAERASGPTAAAGGSEAPRPLVEQIVARLTPLREGRQEIALRLDPPELGGLRIAATLEGRQLSLHITTEQESARHALEGTLPRLRESLAQQGLVADRITVQLGLDASARDSAGGGGGAFARPLAPAPEPVTRIPAPAPRVSRWLPATTEGLDLWA